ncbi:MAG TPA: metal-dependent hydrolase [Thermoplasmata archaeon]|jgi:membrane-bound metal-dependent hydrolase YbcI (DUF457 family)|nr:metal-dependent hydrolase [Thermoplasmata archaeon]
MDLFTHVVFAYLLSFVIWGPASPQYIAAGALAGGLPDADALLFPLARRFPIFEHHGVTHSIAGVTIIAAVGSFLLPFLPYFPHASTLLYFVAMEIGGLSHVFLDGFTHFAVHPLLPFTWKELRLDADVAINVIMLTLTATTLVTLSLERGHVPFPLWVETAWILTAIYGGYLAVRGLARWRAGVARRREGYSAVAPSTVPWLWTLMDRRDTEEEYSIRYRRFRLGEPSAGPERKMVVRKVVNPTGGPITSAQEAIDRTYLAAMAKNRWLEMRPHFGEAVARGGVFEVVWYMVESSGSGRRFGVRGTIDRTTGEMQLKSGFVRLPLESMA